MTTQCYSESDSAWTAFLLVYVQRSTTNSAAVNVMPDSNDLSM